MTGAITAFGAAVGIASLICRAAVSSADPLAIVPDRSVAAMPAIAEAISFGVLMRIPHPAIGLLQTILAEATRAEATAGEAATVAAAAIVVAEAIDDSRSRTCVPD